MNLPTSRPLRVALALAVPLAILLMAGVLALKHLVLPQLGEQRARIERLASDAVGAPVQIAGLQAEWRGLYPHLVLSAVTIRPPGEAPALHLPRVEGRLSWLSLVAFEPRFDHLVLHQPELAIRRDADGSLFVAGVALAGDATGGLPDWLLRQRHIQVREARLVWTDDMLGAPPLRLGKVNLSLFNRLGRHRFGLVATPPEELAARLDVRGDFRGDTLAHPEAWSGRLYARLDGTDLSAWNRWAPWAQPAVKGHACCMRFWADFSAGQVKHLVGDVRLKEVRLKLADAALEQAGIDSDAAYDLIFQELNGRMRWHRLEGAHEIRAENLEFVTLTGRSSAAASARAVVAPNADGHYRLTRAEAEGLRLEALIALADAVPLPKDIRTRLYALNPRGQVDSARIEWLGQNRYRVAARFQNVGLNAWGNWPGFSGLSGEIRGDHQSGRAVLAGRDLRLEMPTVFRHNLEFTDLDGRVVWKAGEAGGYTVDLEQFRLANADLQGEAGGRLWLHPERAPVADIQARLHHGEGAAVWKYLPHKVGNAAYNWLKRAIVGGHSDDTRMILTGPLDKFPFDQGGGDFSVQIKLRDGRLEHTPGWPGIRDIQGWLVFHGMSMSLNADSARILGVDLRQVHARIPDLHYTLDETLFIDGQAVGPSAEFLKFIRQSPVLEYTDRFTDRFQAEGNGQLALKLTLPVRQMDKAAVAGSYRLVDNRIDPGQGLPVLDKVNGEVRFTQSRVDAPRLSALIFDRAAEISLGSGSGGRVRAEVKGRAPIQALTGHLPTALARHMSGETGYLASLQIQGGQTAVRLESDLVGLASKLPGPFDKTAAVAIPLVLSQDGRDPAVDLRYGNLLKGRIEFAEAKPWRAVFGLGGSEFPMPEQGMALRGNLPFIDLDAWRRVLERPDGGDAEVATTTMPVSEVNVSFSELKLAGRPFHDINILATPRGETWALKLNGRELRGDVAYRPATAGAPPRLSGRFARIELPAEKTPPAARRAEPGRDLDTVLDIASERFVYQGRDLGALTLRLTPTPRSWQLDEFVLTTADGQLSAQGELATHAHRQSQLALKLKASNFGRLLDRHGWPGTLKRGEIEVEGKLHWAGTLDHFELARLGGNLSLQARNGQFTKIEPGAARLFGVLSLQSLPRRISLDFRDVFSDGFAFDEIAGTTYIDRGVAYLKAMKMNGPAAEITLGGKIDLAQETQVLHLSIQPRLDESVALGAALLGGPAVGVGALVAGKLLNNPIGQAAGFEYQVTGSWSEPVVTKLQRGQAATTEQGDAK